MKLYKNLLKLQKPPETVLIIVLVMYILLKLKTPAIIADIVDNMYGTVIVTAISLVLFSKTDNPIVGVLTLIAAYEFVKRASESTGTHAIRTQLPSEKKKLSDFAKYNDFPVTLEEEVVSKIAPLAKPAYSSNESYKPIMSDVGLATTI